MNGEYYIESKNNSNSRYDRYKDCKVLEDVDTHEKLLSMREIKRVPQSGSDTYHRVQSHEKNRLDIIAQYYYKNPLLWWVIAQANDIRDPFVEIEAGTLLRIPSIEVLYGNKGILL